VLGAACMVAAPKSGQKIIFLYAQTKHSGTSAVCLTLVWIATIKTDDPAIYKMHQ